ncbi:uncharacterized protein CEXT_797571 [Caerostris extrusa]|uniref:Uncharacterized protein n=1 Tax=Caerostris extrusa TaxID=172846 RepID=A0AAV4UQ48_CAEEX|nr:uncharacterized protein CEXT_797571 [Caerostris extrusa]
MKHKITNNYVIVAVIAAFFSHSLCRCSPTQINAKLHVVQDELHEIARKLEVMSIPGYVHPSESAPAPVYQKALHHRMEELKEEFVELITELRKRKTVAGGIIIDVEDVNYDHDLDGELRRPKRMLSNQSRRPSFTALTTLLSTSRPLLTQYAPSAAHQSLYYVPSDPDMEVRTTPEQQRALLARSNEKRDYGEKVTLISLLTSHHKLEVVFRN